MIGVHASRSPGETRALASRFAGELRPGDVVLLSGDLGAGKTCFVQGMVEGLGCADPVTSPTFALVQEYPTTPPLAHADLYRLQSAEAVLSLGLEECIESGMVLAVEWGERAAAFWPADVWRVKLNPVFHDDQAREILIVRSAGA